MVTVRVLTMTQSFAALVGIISCHLVYEHRQQGLIPQKAATTTTTTTAASRTPNQTAMGPCDKHWLKV